jgi:hypothetical protein
MSGVFLEKRSAHFIRQNDSREPEISSRTGGNRRRRRGYGLPFPEQEILEIEENPPGLPTQSVEQAPHHLLP